MRLKFVDNEWGFDYPDISINIQITNISFTDSYHNCYGVYINLHIQNS